VASCGVAPLVLRLKVPISRAAEVKKLQSDLRRLNGAGFNRGRFHDHVFWMSITMEQSILSRFLNDSEILNGCVVPILVAWEWIKTARIVLERKEEITQRFALAILH
jgi:hypothetical protein